MRLKKEIKKAGRYMSLLLRHSPEKEHLDMDKYGYVSVKQLISVLDIKRTDLQDIVDENDKKRFAFSKDKLKIRASQGHSIDIDLGLPESTPPSTLYHGTATKFLESIYKDGIVSGKRKHVHLSTDKGTATQVGGRHGSVWILIIDSDKMFEDGFKFYLSKNKVWLTDYVPSDYIMEG